MNRHYPKAYGNIVVPLEYKTEEHQLSLDVIFATCWRLALNTLQLISMDDDCVKRNIVNVYKSILDRRLLPECDGWEEMMSSISGAKSDYFSRKVGARALEFVAALGRIRKTHGPFEVSRRKAIFILGHYLDKGTDDAPVTFGTDKHGKYVTSTKHGRQVLGLSFRIQMNKFPRLNAEKHKTTAVFRRLKDWEED